MKPRYYAVHVDAGGNVRGFPSPPRDSYSEAMGVHITEISNKPGRIPGRHYGDEAQPERRVLVDLESIAPQHEDEFARLLLDDPVVRAIFELGRRQGRTDYEHTARMRIEQAGEQ